MVSDFVFHETKKYTSSSSKKANDEKDGGRGQSKHEKDHVDVLATPELVKKKLNRTAFLRGLDDFDTLIESVSPALEEKVTRNKSVELIDEAVRILCRDDGDDNISFVSDSSDSDSEMELPLRGVRENHSGDLEKLLRSPGGNETQLMQQIPGPPMSSPRSPSKSLRITDRKKTALGTLSAHSSSIGGTKGETIPSRRIRPKKVQVDAGKEPSNSLRAEDGSSKNQSSPKVRGVRRDNLYGCKRRNSSSSIRSCDSDKSDCLSPTTEVTSTASAKRQQALRQSRSMSPSVQSSGVQRSPSGISARRLLAKRNNSAGPTLSPASPQSPLVTRSKSHSTRRSPVPLDGSPKSSLGSVPCSPNHDKGGRVSPQSGRRRPVRSRPASPTKKPDIDELLKQRKRCQSRNGKGQEGSQMAHKAIITMNK